MEMLLMGLCVAVFGIAVSCIAFAAATRPEQGPPAVQPDRSPVVTPEAARFFAEDVTLSATPRPPSTLHVRPSDVSIALLLARIENHIRLEQAAAESFVEMPTPTTLHGKTTSTFIN